MLHKYNKYVIYSIFINITFTICKYVIFSWKSLEKFCKERSYKMRNSSKTPQKAETEIEMSVSKILKIKVCWSQIRYLWDLHSTTNIPSNSTCNLEENNFHYPQSLTAIINSSFFQQWIYSTLKKWRTGPENMSSTSTNYYQQLFHFHPSWLQ